MAQYDTEEGTLRGIDTVRVNKDDLLERIKTNRDQHRTIFEEALEGWKKKVTEVLEERYQSALQGKDFNILIHLPRPEDHTDQYDTVIELLGMSLDEELELTQHDFACYALDKWQWQQQFLTTSAHYGSRSAYGHGQFKAPEGTPPLSK
jgi:hypothetical protein